MSSLIFTSIILIWKFLHLLIQLLLSFGQSQAKQYLSQVKPKIWHLNYERFIKTGISYLFQVAGLLRYGLSSDWMHISQNARYLNNCYDRKQFALASTLEIRKTIFLFGEGSRVRQTSEEGRRTYRPKHCGNNHKDEDNSPKTQNDKNVIKLICVTSNTWNH